MRRILVKTFFRDHTNSMRKKRKILVQTFIFYFIFGFIRADSFRLPKLFCSRTAMAGGPAPQLENISWCWWGKNILQ